MPYAEVDGLSLYYEIHGEGRPLVLLHGALGTIDTCFGDVLRYSREQKWSSRSSSKHTAIVATSTVH